MTDGQSALPPGNHTEGRDYQEDQQNDGETIWMSIGMKPPGGEQHKIGKFGAEEDVCMYICRYVCQPS